MKGKMGSLFVGLSSEGIFTYFAEPAIRSECEPPGAVGWLWDLAHYPIAYLVPLPESAGLAIACTFYVLIIFAVVYEFFFRPFRKTRRA